MSDYGIGESEGIARLNESLIGIDHAAPSVSKYRRLEHFLATELGLHDETVYAAFISKAGNASVRFNQSTRAMRATVLVALVEPPRGEGYQRTIDALTRYLQVRPEAECLALRKRDGRWVPFHVLSSSSFHSRLLDWTNSVRANQEIGVTTRDHPSVPEPRLSDRVTFGVQTPDVEAPRPASLPYVVLISTDQDEGNRLDTAFLALVRLPGGESVDLGEVRIMRRQQTHGKTRLPPGQFEMLGNDYCSVGQSYSYYETLRQLPRNIYTSLLGGLRDAVFDNSIHDEFRDEPAFIGSLTRSGAAAAVIEDARPLFQAHTTEARPHRRFSFTTRVGGTSFDVDFRFNQSPELPDRINAVIGYNGTGKTQLLANLGYVACSDLQRRHEIEISHGLLAPSEATRFGSVIAVSYSAFDTFELPELAWSSTAAEIQLEEYGEVSNYVYCGLRKRKTSSDPGSQWSLSSTAEIADQFANAMRRSTKAPKRIELLGKVFDVLRQEPSFSLAGQDTDYETLPSHLSDTNAWLQLFQRLSTGHKIALNILVQIVGHIQKRSLVILDEPEAHLHPSLLSALIRAINLALYEYDSYAVIATHSPVVLQEIPSVNVHIMRRFGGVTSVDQPEIETFAENVGQLTKNVFNLDGSATDFHQVLRTLVKRGFTLGDIDALFAGGLSAQGRAYVRGIVLAGDE